MRRWAERGDEGSILLLTLGFAVLVMSLVLVVTDSSKVFLTRRSLVAAADGAALAGVQSLDQAAYYKGDGGDRLVLDPALAQDAVEAYVADAGLAGEFTDFELVSVTLTADEVAVTVRARSRLPFGAYIGHPDGVVVEATAHTTAPYVTP